MNNKVYFYRVAHNSVLHKGLGNVAHYMGPYAYFNVNLWSSSNVPFDSETLTKFVKFAEREVVEYKKFNINNYKLKCVPTLPNAWRPGPFEDIELRSKMINKMGKMTKNGKFHLYGFDSIAQSLKWYNNPEELEFLENVGFSMYKFLVKSQNMIVGKSQSVYFPDIYDILQKDKIKLTSLNRLLNVPININNNESVSELFV